MTNLHLTTGRDQKIAIVRFTHSQATITQRQPPSEVWTQGKNNRFQNDPKFCMNILLLFTYLTLKCRSIILKVELRGRPSQHDVHYYFSALVFCMARRGGPFRVRY